MLTMFIGVVVLLGGLIFFHEAGHYSVAKWFGVKVEVFSLGFGKKLFSKTIGETEYCLSAFPLGGYVKLMGDDPYKEVPPEEAHRAFSTQKLYKRFAIVAAGPIANLLLAYVLYSIVFWFGLPVPATVVGNVVINSPAYTAGMRSGDKIETINGENVDNWIDYEKAVKPLQGKVATVKILRDSETLDLQVPVSEVEGNDPYGQPIMEGGIKGVNLLPIAPLVGISDPKSPAYQAGLRTGDLITKVEGTGVKTFKDFNETLAKNWTSEKELTFSYQRMGESESLEGLTEQTVQIKVGAPTEAVDSPTGISSALGIHSSDTFVKVITPDSPAEKGGLKPGDRVVALDNVKVYNFESILDAVQEAGKQGRPVQMDLERDGEQVTLSLTPIVTTREDPITHAEIEQFIVGFQRYWARQDAEVTKLQVRNFGDLIPRAVNETNTTAKRMLVSIGMLIMGKLSAKNLGGPVLIARLAGQSLETGLIPFLQMMALISINLFLLNLFPIPVLDGGHLLFFTIEAVQRKPVSIKTMEIANQIGMVVILMLVGLTLFNDIGRIVN